MTTTTTQRLTRSDVRLSRYDNGGGDTGYSVYEKSTGRYIGWVAKVEKYDLFRAAYYDAWQHGLGIGRSAIESDTQRGAVVKLLTADARNRS